MNNRPAAQSIGWNLGILSGVFAALQVLISAATARANIATIESMRWSLSRLETGGGNPFPLLGSLASVVLVTYAAIIITGAISLGLSWYAGRLTAFVLGRHEGGAGAGFRVALLSGAIWIVFSIMISLLLHSDGTITGIIASTPDGSGLAGQLAGLLTQEIILAAIGLGLGAWAGHLGAGGAPVAPESAAAPPSFVVTPAYGAYPAYPGYLMYPTYPSYPGYPGYPGGAPIAPPLSQPQLPPPPDQPQPPPSQSE